MSFYGIDLLGAASGCLIILLLLSWADAISVLFAIATFAAIGAACFAVARRMSAERGPPLAGFRWLGRRGRPVILAAVLGLIAVGNAALQPARGDSKPLSLHRSRLGLRDCKSAGSLRNHRGRAASAPLADAPHGGTGSFGDLMIARLSLLNRRLIVEAEGSDQWRA